ncbi:response regulator [Aurantibacter crassamenti]|uniref:response regulator n=1 Tax=Aurantibacter crassamenti TaxID=1837375 RepID=UPI001939CF55|nr:response regulator [Aurantibacter crassamenti]MBM1107898.1 response regulator [Aurantibacter crassamenti]
MRPMLKTVLLVDDDEATNFIHNMVIKQMNCTENIVIKENGIEALEYLTTSLEGKFPQPDLIFLDINMPAMDGWEFLEEYKKLDKNQLAQTVIVMLTTSLNPDDKDKAGQVNGISGFMSKPLTSELVEKVLVQHFAEQNRLKSI